MLKSKWIWVKNDVVEKDSYAEFVANFSAKQGEKIELLIACDSVYNVEINGTLAAFGNCADYPHAKRYDKADITQFCKAENALKITVWYFGENSSTYALGARGLGFCIKQGGQVLIESSEKVLSRKNINYVNGNCVAISAQLGYNYAYDATVENNLPFEMSEVCGEVTAASRPKKNCYMAGRVPVQISKIDKGYRVDMGRETVGFLEMDFVSPKTQKIRVNFGEHLEMNGEVAGKIAERNFNVSYVATAGENKFRNAFRRLAGRYLDVECDGELEIRYIGLNEVLYPLVKKQRKFDDALLQKIYDVCVHTLVCCMHDHYEDCPWREQALYTMDSRNQMLCGYYAFEGTEFQEHCLRLIAEGFNKDWNLLEICFPSGKAYTIPFFSLVFPIQVCEYYRYTHDEKLKEEMRPIIEGILNAYRSLLDESGLLTTFPTHWNFYEWSDFSNGGNFHSTRVSPIQHDLILNCAYVYACQFYDELYGGHTDNSAIKKAIKDNFFVEERGLYKLCLEGEAHYSRLGNSFAMLIGLENKEFAEKIIHEEQIDVTLSMCTFYYDALLKADESYYSFIVEDIKKKYSKMLDAGATTFWETEKGWQDFGNAGSLCHGWSALPVYYLLKSQGME